MKAKRYTEEQIIAVLREWEAGAKIANLCRRYGMSEASYYNWKAKYAGVTVSNLRRLKALEGENRRLKQIVAEQVLDNLMLKELLSNCSEKVWWSIISGRRGYIGRVAQVLERLAESRRLPEGITLDNGPEFTGKALDEWNCSRGVKLNFIRPDKPIENANSVVLRLAQMSKIHKVRV